MLCICRATGAHAGQFKKVYAFDNLQLAEYRHEEAFMGHDQAFASHFTYHLQLLGDHNASNAAGAVLASAISDAMFRHSFSTACEALSLGILPTSAWKIEYRMDVWLPEVVDLLCLHGLKAYRCEIVVQAWQKYFDH